jgi:hypothetical protein
MMFAICSGLSARMYKLFLYKLPLVFALLLALVAAAPSPAQQLVLPSHFANWSGQPSAEAYETEAPISWVNLWKETGRTTGEYCEYISGEKKLDVGLQKYRDPSSAYEAYTAYLTDDMHPSTVGGPSAIGAKDLFVLTGNIIIDIREQQNASTADLQQLSEIVARHADKAPLPPIRSYLADGFSDGTERYALGPAGLQNALISLHQTDYLTLVPEVGFQSGAEVMLGEYHKGKDSAVLLLIEYPTPQLAGLHSKHFERALAANAKNAGTRMERKGSLLSIVLAPTSAAYAEALRQAVNYETAVTWNEPTHTITDPPLTTTIAKIILATFLLMVIAIVLGIAFGGVRLLTKIFFPGKVFDRPDQLDVLQLGLSSKRIDSRDFY